MALVSFAFKKLGTLHILTMSEEKNDSLQHADGNLENNAPEMQMTENEKATDVDQTIGSPENTEPHDDFELESNNTETENSATDGTDAVGSENVSDDSANADAMIAESEAATATETEDEPIIQEDEGVLEPAEGAELPIETDAEPTTEISEENTDNTVAIDAAETEMEREPEAVSEPVEKTDVNSEETADTEAHKTTEDNTVELTPEKDTQENTVTEDTQQDAISAIASANAEESEDETVRGEIPMQNYEALSMETLVGELEKLVSNEKVMAVKDHVEEVKKAFLEKYHHFIEEKKDEFHAENPESLEEFHYHLPLKTKFDQLYSQYRDRKNTHFKSLQTNLQTNLDKRLTIVEDLKNLINPQENIKDTLKQFNDLRERWKNAGPIPKDKYNHTWNNYHFHVENFYDYLHLDREARDIDFRHNLEQKQKIIARVEELVNEPDINKAFRELQDLHRLWKEDIGPVSREHREDIWNKFSDLTKQMHDKRELLFEQLRGTELENLERKKEIVTRLEALAQEKVDSHSAWTAQVAKVEAARNEFFAAGKVPPELNEETWASFKNAVRNFNVLKNSFYKEIKKDQNDNMSLKLALIAKAKELQESTDYAATTPIMKKIQEEWKQIGHVPRKFSDKLWTDFRAACNAYFENMKANKVEDSPEETEAFEQKKAYLETLRAFEMTGVHKTDLDAIKQHIETWKGFGKVPFPKRHIEGKFNKILDALFEKLSLSKKESDMVRFSNRVNNLSESNDTRKLENEKVFLMRKIDEVQNEIFQLENNIQFFTTKNQKKESPMIAEVRKNIASHKENLQVLKDKLKQLRSVKTE